MTPTEQAADRVKALVERLRAPDEFNNRGPDYEPMIIPPSALRLEAADALTALQARVGELEGALKPFSTVAKVFDRHPHLSIQPDALPFRSGVAWRGADGETTTLTLGDFRKARALLTPPLEQDR